MRTGFQLYINGSVLLMSISQDIHIFYGGGISLLVFLHHASQHVSYRRRVHSDEHGTKVKPILKDSLFLCNLNIIVKIFFWKLDKFRRFVKEMQKICKIILIFRNIVQKSSWIKSSSDGLTYCIEELKWRFIH